VGGREKGGKVGGSGSVVGRSGGEGERGEVGGEKEWRGGGPECGGGEEVTEGGGGGPGGVRRVGAKGGVGVGGGGDVAAVEGGRGGGRERGVPGGGGGRWGGEGGRREACGTAGGVVVRCVVCRGRKWRLQRAGGVLVGALLWWGFLLSLGVGYGKCLCGGCCECLEGFLLLVDWSVVVLPCLGLEGEGEGGG